MHHTIQKVIESEGRILDYYKAASERWQEILKSVAPIVVEKLSTRLSSEQMWFERNCGGRHLGQEIMVVAGIARLYSVETGFGNNEQLARTIAEAFSRSTCSLEVKGIARRVADSYL